MKVKKPNKLFEECKELIKLFLHEGEFSYPKEIAISKKLLKLWPEIEFWRQYDPQRKFHSLSVFLTKECKEHLNKEYQMFLMVKEKPPVVLEKKPVILLEEISKTNKKSKTLLDFVDNIL